MRVRVFAHYFGSGQEADAFNAALKIPNIIRNLAGEGTLSASFIPVYAAMLQRDEREAARTLSNTVASLLVLAAAGGAMLGYVLAPVVTDVVAPGFDDQTRNITVALVRIMFPMAGILILSGWCLGVLNTHRRFFLSYAAPTFWNIAQIATLISLGSWVAGWRGPQLVVALGWGALVGSVLQVLVQLPATLALGGAFRWTLGLRVDGIRSVLRAWVPVVIGAGVWQISSLIDTQLGSFAGAGAVAFLAYAQMIAVLPVSLFGVSVAAASLPELARDAAAASAEATRERLADGARRVAFFIIPSAFALAAHGSRAVAAVFQTGSFDQTQTAVVTGVLAAYSIGLPAQGSVRLITSGHYALGDTRTPLRVAGLTVALAAALAVLFMQFLGVAGIALGSATAAYLNLALNYMYLTRRTGRILEREQMRHIALVIAGSALAALGGTGVSALVPDERIWLGAAATLGTFGLIYVSITAALNHPEARKIVSRIGSRARPANE